MDVENLHDFRKQIDMCISRAEIDMEGTEPNLGFPNAGEYRRAMALVRTKLQEATMWLNKCIEQTEEPLSEDKA